MNQNFVSKNIENNEFNIENEEDDYKNLINRLTDISKTIDLVQKQFLNKFKIFDKN